MGEQQLLTLIVPLDLKDPVVDCLLGITNISGFTHREIAGHSRDHGAFNLPEQVAGSRAMLQFQVLHDPGDQAALLSKLESISSGNALRYWIQPTLTNGHL